MITVTATGVPKPQKDHAALMAKFSAKVMKKMRGFVKTEEVNFGPDTSDLTLRIALHSGPVTGGFLKGKGARFQLFGDTMTTAQILLAHTQSGTIQISEATANLLKNSGKKKWVAEREDKIKTKEKGVMTTFYLTKDNTRRLNELGVAHVPDASSAGDSDTDFGDDFATMGNEKRWIEWNTEVFKKLLKQIVAQRANASSAINTRGSSKNAVFRSSGGSVGSSSLRGSLQPEMSAAMPAEEVQEVIALRQFDKRTARRQQGARDVEIPDNVVKQLRLLVTEVANMYNNNPFHSFAHASTVVSTICRPGVSSDRCSCAP